MIENPKRLGEGVEAPRVPVGAVLRDKFAVGEDVVSVYATT